jgi:hypothetical protein
MSLVSAPMSGSAIGVILPQFPNLCMYIQPRLPANLLKVFHCPPLRLTYLHTHEWC